MLRPTPVTALLFLVPFVGCGSIPQRNPIPEELAHKAQIPGIPNARMWGDEAPRWTEAWLNAPQDDLDKRFAGIVGKPLNMLAISGGGAEGAYGAGLLCGWTKAGTRPQFGTVTGISTGALTAPFAFLGSAYDSTLEQVYTTLETKDLIEARSRLVGLTSDALSGTDPLRRTIARFLTDEVIEEIAVQHRSGRSLMIGTTDMDAGRPVIWMLSAIAASDHPAKRELIHSILLASASIPVAFPPVFIKVEAEGKIYDEMHVDGGVTAQVFLYPTGVDWGAVIKRLRFEGTPSVYVIRNAKLAAPYATTTPSLLSIAGRAISSLIRTQGFGDLIKIYLQCKRDGLKYHLSVIPESFTAQSEEFFDPKYMGKLFQVGFAAGLSGRPWRTKPPGF